MGLQGVVRDQEIDRCFEELDGDGSGRIDYSELNKKIREFAGLSSAGRYKLRRTAGGRKGAALSSTVKIDPHSESSVAQQLRGVLREHAVRVVDLFRDWDEDGNGTISKLEFAQVVPLLVRARAASANPSPHLHSHTHSRPEPPLPPTHTRTHPHPNRTPNPHAHLPPPLSPSSSPAPRSCRCWASRSRSKTWTSSSASSIRTARG